MANETLNTEKNSGNKCGNIDFDKQARFFKINNEILNTERPMPPSPVSTFKIEGRLLKDIVLELSKKIPIFDVIYSQQEFFNGGGIWYRFEEICQEKDLSTIEKLINYYINSPTFDGQL